MFLIIINCIYLGCQADGGTHTVYYVHYARLDRRMDEWIDIHEIHSAVDKPNTPSSSQSRSNFIMPDLSDSPTKKTRSQRKKAEEFQHNEKAPIDFGATLARCEEKHEKVCHCYCVNLFLLTQI